jgi:hypothetical protein
MLRRMEFNADRIKIGLVGSQVFEETLLGLVGLNVAAQSVILKVAHETSARHTIRNIPLAICQAADPLLRGDQKELEQWLARQQPSLFDTHPSSRRRIAEARRLNERGIFSSNRYASEIFRDLTDLCEKVTEDCYRNETGLVKRSERQQRKDWLVKDD